MVLFMYPLKGTPRGRCWVYPLAVQISPQAAGHGLELSWEEVKFALGHFFEIQDDPESNRFFFWGGREEIF